MRTQEELWCDPQYRRAVRWLYEKQRSSFERLGMRPDGYVPNADMIKHYLNDYRSAVRRIDNLAEREEFQRISRYIVDDLEGVIQSESCINLPIWSGMLMRAYDAVVGASEGASFPKSPPLIIGTLPTYEYHGAICAVNGAEKYKVVVIDFGMLSLMEAVGDLIAKCLTPWKDDSGDYLVSFAHERLLDTFNDNRSLSTELSQTILHFVSDDFSVSPRRERSSVTEHTMFFSAINALLFFLVGHEYSHSALGHLLEAGKYGISDDVLESRWRREYEADSMSLLLGIMPAASQSFGLDHRTFSMMLLGSFAFLMALLDIVDQLCATADMADMVSRLRTHPPSNNRIAAAKEALEMATEPGETRQMLLAVMEGMTAIPKRFWLTTKGNLRTRYCHANLGHCPTQSHPKLVISVGSVSSPISS